MFVRPLRLDLSPYTLATEAVLERSCQTRDPLDPNLVPDLLIMCTAEYVQ